MDYDFYTTDVFTTQRFGGNPLAVFPHAAGLDTPTMQKIAREFNLSETIFMFPPEDPANTCKVRIFTPNLELPFAGHPTVGGAFVLATIGQVALTGTETEIAFEEGVGRVPIKIFADKDGAVTRAVLSAAVVPDVVGGAPDAALITEFLSLNPGDVLTHPYKPEVVKAGTPRLFVPVKDADALARVDIDLAKWRKQIPETRSVYVYTADPDLNGADFRARMFVVPQMGIYEDPATGSAVTGLAAYLATKADQQNGTIRWTLQQGVEMGRPSIIDFEIDLKDGVCRAVRVGGSAVMVSKGTFFV